METLPIQIAPLTEQIQTVVPKMVKGRDAAIAAAKEVVAIDDDEARTSTVELIAAVETTRDKMKSLREPITKETDKLKQLLMQFEKDVDVEAVRLRGLIGKYDQQKIDEKKKKEEEARKLKERENYKVDLATRIRTNLSGLVIARVEQASKGAKDWFDASTLENFDERAKMFNSFNAKLKMETYDGCFAIGQIDGSKITKEEWDELVAKVKSEEPYEKYNEQVVEKLVPILNEWKAKIPTLKQALIDMANAKDEEEKKRLQAKKEVEEKAQQQRRDEELKRMKEQQERDIAQREQIEKMSNDFQEQAIIQEAEDVGPVKLIGRLSSDKPVQVKALCEMIYHCMMHPKFPGIVQLSKDKQPKLDEHGFPEYVDGVDFWLKFYLRYCDVKIEGVEKKEVSKTIIRKS
jgi:hypothetical protein